MAFVCVVDLGVDSEFFKQEYAADAEEVFLFDAVFPVAAVELVCDYAVEFGVHVEVGVHEVEFHASDVDAPYVGVYYTAGVWHFEYHGVSVFVEDLFDGELVEVLGLVVG